MMETEVFEIPIYRCSPEEFGIEFDELHRRHNYLLLADGTGGNPFSDLSEEQRDELSEFLERSWHHSPDSRAWKYNDIIGYVSILAWPKQIKAEYWFIDSKRIGRKTVRKQFRYRDKVFEFWIRENEASHQIYEHILNSLLKLMKRKPFKGRYLDLEAFENTGPLVDWRALTRPE